MGAWGYEWNESDQNSDYILDVLEEPRRQLLESAKLDSPYLEEAIDHYRVRVVVYSKLYEALGVATWFTPAEKALIEEANRRVTEYLTDEANAEKSSWDDFQAWGETVLSELKRYSLPLEFKTR